jgi:TRAP-type C4-dicarboxylate transport system permease small subunit
MEASAASGRAGRALEAASLGCRFLAILFLIVMTVCIVGQVIGRNVFNVGMPWADELSRVSGIAIVFLAVPLLALRGQHVAVDMVPMLLKPRARRIVLVAAELMVLGFSAFMLFALQAFLLRAGKFATPAMGLTNWFVYTPAMIGFALLALVTILRLVVLVRGERPVVAELPAQ